MELHWTIYVGVALLATAQWTAAQHEDTESEEEEAIPPLITAEIPDHLHFVLDEEFQLDCKAEGTEPITYEWMRIAFESDGERSVEQLFSHDHGNAHVSLSKLIVDAAEIQNEGLYQCEASNKYGTVRSKIVRVYRAYITRPKAKDPVVQYEAMEGDPYYLECDESRSNPKASFTWVLKNTAAKTSEPVETSDRVVVAADGSLRFAHVERSDASGERVYQCNQRNPATDVKYGGSGKSLTVVHHDPERLAPQKWKTFSVPDDTMVVGQSTRIQCIFSGNPAPRVTWSYKENGASEWGEVPEVLYHPGKKDNLDRTSLVHAVGKKLGKKDEPPPPEGLLRCAAENSEGAEHVEMPLKIQYPPRLAASPRGGRRAEEGDTVFFVCGGDGNPAPKAKFIINGRDVDPRHPGHRRTLEESQMDWKPYVKEYTTQLVLTIKDLCYEDCEGGSDTFSIQCNVSNIHGSSIGSGYLSVYKKSNDSEAAAAEQTGDPDACTDEETVAAVDQCRETYQEAASSDLCLAYCHYNVCVSDLELDCKPQSIGDRSFCNGLCIEMGLMKDPEESKRRGPSRTVIIIIIIVLLVLILIVLLFVIYKIYKKRQQRKKYKGVSAVYKPTTQA